ncbi:hypothetical protein LZ32DRAFT_173406 [Colletotrichum eremochloae]|nr:hypothetical protein LZ32DRAFT_173406 [Colletotrichum eremochloae]
MGCSRHVGATAAVFVSLDFLQTAFGLHGHTSRAGKTMFSTLGQQIFGDFGKVDFMRRELNARLGSGGLDQLLKRRNTNTDYVWQAGFFASRHGRRLGLGDISLCLDALSVAPTSDEAFSLPRTRTRWKTRSPLKLLTHGRAMLEKFMRDEGKLKQEPLNLTMHKVFELTKG